jgi:hypothetical protein
MELQEVVIHMPISSETPTKEAVVKHPNPIVKMLLSFIASIRANIDNSLNTSEYSV